jgi:hypothetical protein
MQGANLGGSDLREAKFECDMSGQTGPGGPEYRCTQIQGASFVSAQLQASSFSGAQLAGALLYRAHLEGASLNGADLTGAALDRAHLQAAYLDSAHLNGASLASAQLQGAVLDFAELKAASLDGAQLQGATLKGAKLDWASLRKIFAWHADIQQVSANGVRVDAETKAQESCLGLTVILSSDANCSWSTESFARLKQLINDQIPNGPLRKDALARIQRLDPTQRLDGEQEMGVTWQSFKSPSLDDYEKGKSDLWRAIGCANRYVLRGLITQMGNVDDVAFSATSRSLPELATFFASDNCAAGRELSETELSSLKFLGDRGGLAPSR